MIFVNLSGNNDKKTDENIIDDDEHYMAHTFLSTIQ